MPFELTRHCLRPTVTHVCGLCYIFICNNNYDSPYSCIFLYRATFCIFIQMLKSIFMRKILDQRHQYISYPLPHIVFTPVEHIRGFFLVPSNNLIHNLVTFLYPLLDYTTGTWTFKCLWLYMFWFWLFFFWVVFRKDL